MDLVQARHHSHAGFRDAVQGVEHRGGGLRIQARHRLVRQDHLGFLRERAGDRHALLLSSRELISAGVGSAHEPHGVEATKRELAVGAREAAQQHTPGRYPRPASREDVLARR